MNILLFEIFSIMLVTFSLFGISLFFMNALSNEMSETAFECGFEPFFLPRVPFSIHFFTITIVFLIFDLEVLILLPILFKTSSINTLIMISFITWVLILGLVVEWYDNSLDWQM